MYDSIETLEYTDMLLSIEEIKAEIENNYRVINDGIRAVNLIDNMVKINSLSLETNVLNNEVFKITLNTLNLGLESIGCNELIINENISLEDNVKDVNISIEGVGADIWLAIKKIFEKIGQLMNAFYENIRKFFGVAKVKAIETKSKLDGLPDLSDFEIEKGAQAKFIDKVKKLMPLYSVMGLDILSDSDFKKYNECILVGNRWILENTTLLIKGTNNDTPNSLSTPSKLGLINTHSTKAFQNARGIIEKKYTEKVNCHYLVAAKHNGAIVVTILKDKNVTKLVHSPLTIDNNNLDKLHKKSLSKLNKNRIHGILEMINKLGEEEEKFKKDSDSFKQKLELEFKDLSNKQLGSEAIFTTNTNTAGNIMSTVAEALVKHIAIYQTISDNLTNIYAAEAKKVNK